MTTIVPPSCTVAPAARAPSSSVFRRAGQNGSAKPMWATIPPSKKVCGERWRVRSYNWSAITMWRGASSFRSDPHALLARMRRRAADYARTSIAEPASRTIGSPTRSNDTPHSR